MAHCAHNIRFAVHRVSELYSNFPMAGILCLLGLPFVTETDQNLERWQPTFFFEMYGSAEFPLICLESLSSSSQWHYDGLQGPKQHGKWQQQGMWILAFRILCYSQLLAANYASPDFSNLYLSLSVSFNSVKRQYQWSTVLRMLSWKSWKAVIFNNL